MKHVELTQDDAARPAVPPWAPDPITRLFDHPDPTERLWRRASYFAMIFCLWFAFVSPVVLIITHWP